MKLVMEFQDDINSLLLGFYLSHLNNLKIQPKTDEMVYITGLSLLLLAVHENDPLINKLTTTTHKNTIAQ